MPPDDMDTRRKSLLDKALRLTDQAGSFRSRILLRVAVAGRRQGASACGASMWRAGAT